MYICLYRFIRIVKCGIALGDLVTAENAIKQAEKLQPGSTTAEMRALEKIKYNEKEAIKANDSKDFRKVVYCMDRCLDEAPSCEKYKLTKAECLAILGR